MVGIGKWSMVDTDSPRYWSVSINGSGHNQRSVARHSLRAATIGSNYRTAEDACAQGQGCAQLRHSDQLPQLLPPSPLLLLLPLAMLFPLKLLIPLIVAAAATAVAIAVTAASTAVTIKTGDRRRHTSDGCCHSRHYYATL